MKSGILEADDINFGSTDNENEVVSLIVNQNWESLLGFDLSEINGKNQLYLSRSFPFNKIDKIRTFLKRGDL